MRPLSSARVAKCVGGGTLISMNRIQFVHAYKYIISLENLLEAWKEFARGKRSRNDVQEFELNLMSNIIKLHNDLASGVYMHGEYQAFRICDPKPRDIHKATVRDRLLHHAIYRKLYPFFDRTFIEDSFSCRIGKGTHKALNRFRAFCRIVSRNNTRTCWVLKCDIQKFFASIDHKILLDILKKYIPDEKVLWLLERVVASFYSTRPGIGLPLGNLTSQLFCNIYMNEFDQFVKHRLKATYYVRYADDFVFLFENRNWLVEKISIIRDFLQEKLRLVLHPKKLSLKTLASGVDFLGWAHFPDHRILRTSTRKRMNRRIQENPAPQTYISYLGLLRHGNTHKIQRVVEKEYLLSQEVSTPLSIDRQTSPKQLQSRRNEAIQPATN